MGGCSVRALGAALGALCVMALAGEARAAFTFCNETAETRSVAIGFMGQETWESAGWWNVTPGACQQVYDNDLTHQEFYIRATKPDGSFERGEGFTFCTTSAAFNITGDEDCEGRGYRVEDFLQVNTGETGTDYTFTLTPDEGAAETYEVYGTFHGCDHMDGVLACDVASDGWVYHAVDDGRSPEALLERLNNLPMGAGVTITGVVLGQGDISSDVTLKTVEPLGGESAMDRANNLMVGLWRSVDDSRSTRRFEPDGRVYDYYDGDLLTESLWELTETCPTGGPKGAGPVLVIQEYGDAAPMCFGASGLENWRLELVYFGRGNTLTYERDGF